ncbi:C-C motif chemokine 8-like [Osmerus mordax]|uniref:C-C motif chemokine 8-like n=1 Tax=Osmerus mordax TaxID=8014 RepID=UPI00350FEABE
MRSSLVSSTLLSIIAWMAGAYANNGPSAPCCLLHSTTKVKLDQIQDYTVQTDQICNIPAIVFFTKKGIRICSSPNSDWSKKTMGKVDKEKREVERKEEKRGLGEVAKKEEKRDTTSHGPVVSHEPHKGSKRGQRKRQNKRRRNRKPGPRGQRKSAKKGREV